MRTEKRRSYHLGWVALAALGALVATGCEPTRFKAVESFQSATTPNPPPTWKGDKYAAGSLADATGGLNPQSSYTRGEPAKAATTKTDPYANRVKGEPLPPAPDEAAPPEEKHGESAGH